MRRTPEHGLEITPEDFQTICFNEAFPGLQENIVKYSGKLTPRQLSWEVARLVAGLPGKATSSGSIEEMVAEGPERPENSPGLYKERLIYDFGTRGNLFKIEETPHWILASEVFYGRLPLTLWVTFAGVRDIFDLQAREDILDLWARFPDFYRASYSAITSSGYVEDVRMYLKKRSSLILNPRGIAVSMAQAGETTLLNLTPYVQKYEDDQVMHYTNVLLYSLPEESFGLYFGDGTILSSLSPDILLHEAGHHRRFLALKDRVKNMKQLSDIRTVSEAYGRAYSNNSAPEERYTWLFVIYLLRRLGVPWRNMRGLLNERIEPALWVADRTRGVNVDHRGIIYIPPSMRSVEGLASRRLRRVIRCHKSRCWKRYNFSDVME